MIEGSYINTMSAIQKLGLNCRFDTFHREYTVNDHALTVFGRPRVQILTPF
jgi:hypothetical protein